MSGADRERRAAREAEIRARLGRDSEFFRSAASTEIADRLWDHAKLAYLDSGIPCVFKEELFTYLSRFCEAPYSMVRYAAFLLGLGHPAGESSAALRAPEQLTALLRRPLPRGRELERHLKALAGLAGPIEAWPEDGTSTLGAALFACAVHIFLRGDSRSRCLVELRRVLGDAKLEALISLLGFVRTTHTWAEAHPELDYETEVADLLRREPQLGAWFEHQQSAVDRATPEGSAASRFGNDRELLEQSAHHLGAILDDSLTEIYVFDAETLRFTVVNRGARENLGYTLEEFRQLTPLDLKPEFSAESFEALLAPLRSGAASRLEFTTVHRRKDGSSYPVAVHLQRSTTTRRRAFVAITLDIADRIQQGNALAESEARSKTILETAPDAIVTISESGVIESVNAATLKLFGYAESELIGQNVRILMPPRYADDHEDYLERYRRTGKRRIIGTAREIEALRKDGVAFPIRLSVGEAVFDHTRMFTGVIHDLSAQKSAEAERDERDRRLRALFAQRTSLTGICTLGGVLLEANRASLDYVGVQRRDVVGRLFWETPWWDHDPDLQRQLQCGLERAAQGEHVRFDATHPRRDGTLGTVDFHITPVTDANGAIDVLLVESVDITDKRKLQEQLVRSQKMEAVGTLAGGIAHDFNNLLTSIRGSSEILVENLGSDERLLRSAARIQRAVDRATALTTRLLGFSRKQVRRTSVFDVNDAVREARELCVRTIPEDIELKLDLSREALYVRADEGQISQVLMNLVVNAVDAMPAGGRLKLTTARESLRGTCAETLDLPEGEYAVLGVGDTGTGIPAETLAQIFDPFFTTKEVGKGTGLGLSTSLAIVRESGGAIEVETEVGAGTVFSVWLQAIAAPEARSQALAPATDRARSSGETVLLVEDDAVMRDLVIEVLEESGYAVLVAAQADEALARAHSHDGRIDLVITDVVMPSTSGFLLAQALREQRPDLRVLYMSGYTDQVLADRGQLGEDDPFIRKPFGNDQLLRKIREVLA